MGQRCRLGWLESGQRRTAMRVPNVPGGGYQLVTGAEHRVQKHLREQEVQILRALHEQADGSPRVKRKRVEAEVEDCNAIYIMFDPKRPNRCKIGAGNGDCIARRTVARLWTDGEAELVWVEHVGSGYAQKAEISARRQLELKGHRVKGEWVECKWSLAVPILQDLGNRARAQLARVQGSPPNEDSIVA